MDDPPRSSSLLGGLAYLAVFVLSIVLGGFLAGVIVRAYFDLTDADRNGLLPMLAIGGFAGMIIGGCVGEVFKRTVMDRRKR
jgi:predicted permease